MTKHSVNRKKKDVIEVAARRPGPSPSVLMHRTTLGTVFYRDDSNPAAAVWYHGDDPNARGTLVLLPK
jgi:hypothetical protein